MFWVYILTSGKDGQRYIGSTTNLTRRLKEHNEGYVRSTKARRPLKLWAHQSCDPVEQAASLEKVYKRSSGSIKRAVKRGELKLVRNGV